MADEFPADILQFIDHYIESLAQLESLLLLRKRPDRAWSAEEIAKELYITPEMASLLLPEITRQGFAKPAPDDSTRFVYNEAHPLDGLIAELASVYQERRVAVISKIYSKPLNKVQTFADAFRLRKENPP